MTSSWFFLSTLIPKNPLGLSRPVMELLYLYLYSYKVTKIHPATEQLNNRYQHVFTLCLTGFRGKSLHAVTFLNSENFVPNLTTISRVPLSPLLTVFMRKGHFCHKRINNREKIKWTVTTNFTLCIYFLMEVPAEK